jgi:hypothetical protein
VLAAADGRVTVARDSGDLCGLIIVIVHDPHGYRTIYCHSSSIFVKPGEMVTRGQPIGTVGTTGQRAWPGFEESAARTSRTPPAQSSDASTRPSSIQRTAWYSPIR